MKVKNIVFSGFAAAILMGVATDANADTHVVTKGYIDSLNNTVSAIAGNYVTGVTQTAGKVMSVAETGFDTEINAQSTNNNAPTSKAVRDYVTGAVDGITYSGDTYISVDNGTNEIGLTNITSAASGIDTNDTGLTTGKAVYDFVTEANTEYTSADSYISVDNINDTIGLTNIAGESTGITDGSSALTTANAVFDYVTANEYSNGEHITVDNVNNTIAVSDITSSGQDIGTGDTGLTTGNAVHEYVTGAVNALDNTVTADAGKYVSGVTQTDGKVVSVATTGFDTAISQTNPSETTAPTTKAVVDYVTQLTGGVLPTTDCTSGNCALVKIGSTVQWVDLTTPVQDQTTGG